MPQAPVDPPRSRPQHPFPQPAHRARAGAARRRSELQGRPVSPSPGEEDQTHEPHLVSIPDGSDSSSGRNLGNRGASTAGLQGRQELKPTFSGWSRTRPSSHAPLRRAQFAQDGDKCRSKKGDCIMADWVKVAGSLSAISAGSRTTVWGVNAASAIYHYTNYDGSPWINIPGGLSDIGAAADGTVWGVNSGNQIYRYTGDQSTTNWLGINGSLVRIDAGSRTNVWGVDSAGSIYRYTNHDANPWLKIPGSLSDIGAAADGTVWGVNSSNRVYRYTGDQDPSDPWADVNGSLKRIAVGSRTNVWGVDPAGSIYRYTNNDASGGNPWVKIPGTATDIAAGADGTAWHINSAGDIFRYTGDQPS
ncbi:tectonin domain-containing protein [Streptomyces anulatus]|uniref:tectonin domain-containing protein n=1 Tax=Streptomyces TaxID=1883 RepID=UPI0032B804F2